MSEIKIERSIFRQEDLTKNEETLVSVPDKDYNISGNVKEFILGLFPIVDWLSDYHCKTDLPADILSGLAVAVMQLPTGIAYGMLANVPPVFGIYTGIFPMFIYVIFGSSRHLSLGTFAVVCLMVGKTVLDHSTHDAEGMPFGNGSHMSNEKILNVELLSAITFTVALFQIAMYICRLGILSHLISDVLVNSFTIACGIHTAVSQMNHLLGLPVEYREGYFRNVFNIYDIVVALPKANYMAVIISAFVIIFLWINEKFIKPQMKKICPMPLPVELITILVITLVSYLKDIAKHYDIEIIGKIPKGLPAPMLPVVHLIPRVTLDSLAIALVAYTITVSMGISLARKANYEVVPNQELLALGLGNLVGSFFKCIPISVSLSRSIVQYEMGGVTQIVGFISCMLLVLVLVGIAPIFEYLPKCVLASMVLVHLTKLFVQITYVKRVWQLSKLDAIIWIITFTTVAFLDIGIGLVVGITTSLIVLFVYSFHPNASLLGVIRNTEIYVKIEKYKIASEIDGIKLFHYQGGINFATKRLYRNRLLKLVNINPTKILYIRNKQKKKLKPGENLEELKLPVKCIILDFAAITFIDPSGVESLERLQTNFNNIGITIYISCVLAEVYAMFQIYDKIEKNEPSFIHFPTIHDAVLYAKQNLFEK